MFTPDDPFIINIAEHVPSLKNSRSIMIFDNGNKALLKSKTVKRYIANARSSIRRQLDASFSSWEPLLDPVVIGVIFYLQYTADLPDSDQDNKYTTVQECLKDLVIADDNQVEHFIPFRIKIPTNRECCQIFIYKSSFNFIDKLNELHTFIGFLQEKNYGRVDSSQSIAAHNIAHLTHRQPKTTNWF